MSRITNPILPQAWEYVRDRIAEILIDELNGQFLLTGNYDIDADVFTERSTPFSITETPAVNVSVAKGAYGNKHQGSVTGTYVFNIDVYTNAKTTDEETGDTTSALKLQRLIGICRAILEDPIYKTLGFTPPFIQRVFCNQVDFAQVNKEDAANTAMGRLECTVMVSETSILIVPNLIQGYETVVKIDNTNKGYFYQGENY